MLYVDIPTSADIAALTSYRGDLCVSIYLPTTPVTQETRGDRIELKNLAKEAIEQIHAAGGDKRRTALIAEQLDDLVDDDEFWRFQAHSLAIFATPESLRTYRVPNALQAIVEVSDRFFVKPLFRAVSFPNACYVLALAQRSVRLVEVSPDLPAAPVKVEPMPEDAGRAVRGVGEVSHWPSGRIQGAEGQKVLLRQFARKVDQALRPLLGGSGLPLILAAAEPLASIYRSVNTYPQLADAIIEGSPEGLTEAELADRARPILDGIYRDQIAACRTLFQERRTRVGRRRTSPRRHGPQRSARWIPSWWISIRSFLDGSMKGAISFAEQAGPTSYGVVDEITARVIATGGRVIGVRRANIPGEQSLAAILRYPV